MPLHFERGIKMITGLDYTKLANDIYEIVDGADHKYNKAAKVQEIYDWLREGDIASSDNVNTLAAEWADYDVEVE
jgi:hypothetical protein